MASTGNPPYPDEYEYQAPPQQATMPPTMGSLARPTLDVYYHHQPQHAHHHHQGYYQPAPTPSPHHVHHPAASLTPHAYYAAPHQAQHHHYMQHYASTPAALASSSSLKRKMSSGSNSTTPGAASTPGHSSASPSGSLSHDKLCDLCHHPDPILFSAKCGHLFHSRCVHVWPLSDCPVCHVELPQVSILRIDMNEQIETRSGKWTRAEEKFIEIILQEFDRSCFPLANGTPVRLVLAKLLNCSTMRLSKKFQKNALGKRTFRIPKPAKGLVALEFNLEDHVMREKEFSRLETIFRHELVEQFRRENNTDEGAYVETTNLRKAVKQFWVANFLKFSVVVGQTVDGLDVSDAKKKKLALQLLREGNYDDLLSWQSSPSSPLSHGLSSGATAAHDGSVEHHHHHHHQVATHWPTSYGNPADVEFQQQPMKKQRTPETVARMQINCEAPPGHFDLHAQHQHHQQQQQQQHHQQQHSATAYDYSRPAMHPGFASQYPQDVYSSYPASSASTMKQERSPVGSLAHSPPQQHHQQVQPYPEPSPTHEMTAYLDRHSASAAPMAHPPAYRTMTLSASTPLISENSNYQAIQNDAGVDPASSGAGNPWEGLLDEISNEPAQNAVDPSLQAWSNLNMM